MLIEQFTLISHKILFLILKSIKECNEVHVLNEKNRIGIDGEE